MPVVIGAKVGAATDVGLVRANNQDQYLVSAPLFAVADGMGGHAAGEVASATACAALEKAFCAREQSADALVEAAREANRAVFEQARTNPAMHGMGTTLVAAALTGDPDHQQLAIAHVGDSRVYRMRDGELSQVTTDHSLVAELVAEGQIAAEEAEYHPQRHVLSRALGVYADVDVDLNVVDPKVGDRLLLCSDGLSREVDDGQVAAILRRLSDPEEAAEELVAEAKAGGGSDNITVVLIDLVEEPANAAAAAAAAPTLGVDRSDGDATTRVGAIDAAIDATTAVPAVDPGGTRAVPVVAGAAPGPGEGAGGSGGNGDGPEPGRRQRRRRARRARGHPKARIVTVRVVAFLIVLLAVIAFAVAGVGWYARSSYYVGLQGTQLIIYQGRPGGVLWFKPTVAARTGVTTSQIESRHLTELTAGMVEPSLGAARQYVANLRAEEQQAQSASGSSPSPLTTPITIVPKTNGGTSAAGGGAP